MSVRRFLSFFSSSRTYIQARKETYDCFLQELFLPIQKFQIFWESNFVNWQFSNFSCFRLLFRAYCSIIKILKIDVKEDKTLKRDVNKINGIKQLHSGNHVNSTNSVPNLSYFSLPCEHNIDRMKSSSLN